MVHQSLQLSVGIISPYGVNLLRVVLNKPESAFPVNPYIGPCYAFIDGYTRHMLNKSVQLCINQIPPCLEIIQCLRIFGIGVNLFSVIL